MSDPSEHFEKLMASLRELDNAGHYEEVIARAEEARRIAIEHFGPNSRQYARTSHVLGRMHGERGNWVAAAELLQQSYEIRLHTDGESHRDTAAVVVDLGRAHASLGRHDVATRHYQRALDTFRDATPQDGAALANCLNNLASLKLAAGQYKEADQLYAQALAFLRRDPACHRAYISAVTANRARVRRAMQDTDGAESLLRDAIQHDESGSVATPLTARNLTALASIHLKAGEISKAEAAARRALELYDEVRIENSATADAISILGVIALDHHGNLEDASALIERAIDIWQRTAGPSSREFAQALTTRGCLNVRRGEFTKAEDTFWDSIRISQRSYGDRHPIVEAGLMNLASLYAATNRLEQALRCFLAASSINDDIRGQVFAAGTEQQRLAFASHDYIKVSVFITFVVNNMPDDHDAADGALQSVLRHKRAVLESLGIQRDLINDCDDADLANQRLLLATLRQQLATAYAQAASSSLSGPTPEELNALKREAELVEAALVDKVPSLAFQKAMSSVTCRLVADALPPGSRLIEYFRYVEVDDVGSRQVEPFDVSQVRYVAFVMEGGDQYRTRVVPLGDATTLDDQVKRFRSAIMSRDRSAQEQYGFALSLKLIATALPDACVGDKIICAPDGALINLPFGVLPLPTARVGDYFNVSYVGCGRDLLRFAPARGVPGRSAVVVGAPDFDLRGAPGTSAAPSRERPYSSPFDLRFSPLKGTETEAMQIAEQLGVKAWVGKDALKARIRSVRSPAVLHIATHGFFIGDEVYHGGEAPLNPMLRSGLALAAANTRDSRDITGDDAEDGLLTAADVSAMDLKGTELVVLSACDTGRGAIAPSEGLFGLRRGFVLAGAQTLVVSLWRVDDDATTALMNEFYRELFASDFLDIPSCLWRAQTKIRERHPDVALWAPFVCEGNPRWT